ncbi:HAD-IA family hydrolase [Sphingobacterium sp. Mn56C]|uniref:HAD-IA family hydrolase n=1 Tax=Sphingobacterium sp. Mn56C TaxID=3395261 RepID=UPI003BE1E28D
MIQKVFRKLHIEHYFDSSISADFVAKGKPSPDIYLKAALDLLTHPSKCIVFDDSIAGIRAAHAAAMMVVAVPESGKLHDVRFDIADLKIRKLSDFCKQHLAFLNIKAAT